MKEILILTLRLGFNYGGILQAYALQEYLKSLGYNAKTSTPSIYPSTFRQSLTIAKRKIKQLTGGRGYLSFDEEAKNISPEPRRFVQENIECVDLYSKKTQNDLSSGKYFALVTGSDQVWRAEYVDIPLYMFSFAKNINIKKISYAASFGKDDFSEYSKNDLSEAGELIKLFDGVSVREDSGVEMCKSQFSVSAIHSIDPTLLISKEKYSSLIEEDSKSLYEPEGDMFVYVLDRGDDKRNIIEEASRHTDFNYFEVLSKDFTTDKEYKKDKDAYKMKPVTQWLRSFRDAKYIVTDSFHGTVFSIIFNKPFVAIGNKERGLARFTSLLKMFDLEDRLVTSADDVTEELINRKIDWDFVNAKIKAEQKRSFDYLKKHLG